MNHSFPPVTSPPIAAPASSPLQSTSSGSGAVAAAAGEESGGGQTQNSTIPDPNACSGYVFNGGCEVFTDEYGHPHYKMQQAVPSNPYDVVYAVGFDHMRRYPVATTYSLRMAAGDLAPRLGQRFVNKDISMRHWQIEETAKGYIPCPPPAADLDWRQVLAAYTAGLNAGLAIWQDPVWMALLINNTEPVSLPIHELERLFGAPADPNNKFQEWHVMAWGVVQQNHLPLSVSAQTFGTVLKPPGSQGSPVWQASSPPYDPYGILPGGGSQVEPCPPLLPASNSWMLHPSIVAGGGGPIIASDPHLPVEFFCDEWGLAGLNFRSIFQSVHTAGFNWAGWTVPGLPFGGVGTNNNVATAITQNATFPFHLFWKDTAVTDPNYPDVTWGSNVYSYSGSQLTVQHSYFDPATNLQQPVQVELKWLDAARTIPIYASAIPVGGQSTDRRDFWTVAPSLFQSVSRAQSQFEHWYRLAQATSINDIAIQMANQTQTYGNFIATDRLGGMGYWHQGTTPLRPAASASQFAPVGWLEEAVAANEVNPQMIHPITDRPNTVSNSGTTPIEPAWICNNAPPHEVVPSAMSPAAMLTLTNTYPWIFGQDPVNYQSGNTAYGSYSDAPLPPPGYRNLRSRDPSITPTTPGSNDMASVEAAMTDTYDSRGMATREHWLHIIEQMRLSSPATGLVWPGIAEQGARARMRDALIAWGSGPESGLSLPQGASSQGAAVMALLEAAVQDVIRNSAYLNWSHALDLDPRWLTERSPERIPPLGSWTAPTNNLPTVSLGNVPVIGGSALTPGLMSGDYIAERTVMAWAVVIADYWLTAQGQGGPGNNLLNEEYWEARIGPVPPSPSALSAPWNGPNLLPSNAAGVPVLLEDPFGWRRATFVPDQLPEIGILKVMDWGARDSLSTQSGWNYLVDTFTTQHILPMGGANTSVFLQRMVSLNAAHFPTFHDPGITNQTRDNRYDPMAGGAGVSLSTGYHYDSRLIGDSHALLLVQLDVTGGPAEVRVLPAIGATEIYSIDWRYATSQNFSDREMIAFPNDPSSWSATSFPSGWTFYPL